MIFDCVDENKIFRELHFQRIIFLENYIFRE